MATRTSAARGKPGRAASSAVPKAAEKPADKPAAKAATKAAAKAATKPAAKAAAKPAAGRKPAAKARTPQSPRTPDGKARPAFSGPVAVPSWGPPPSTDEALQGRLRLEMIDGYDEELELEFEDRTADNIAGKDTTTAEYRAQRRWYFEELFRLQAELVKLQDWTSRTGQKAVILFEGRDAAGKGGVIKRVVQRLNPRVCRTVALPAPSDRERTQWYFQRYVPHLPAAGEIVLFDRSWYNRAGVERVMGFCSDEEYEEFFRSVPEFERMLVRSGIRLIKYWFSISDDEQQARFLSRIHDPMKQWKLSPMDMESRRRWEDYTRAKEVMLERTHIPEARWWLVQAVDKKRARLNCIRHLLSQFPYEEVARPPVELPPRVHHPDYHRAPTPPEMLVPDYYRPLEEA